MNIMSLFDGIACGYEALLKAGIDIGNYWASEIDPYALQVANKNHPDIIHLGDVTKINFQGLLDPIDLLIGGSPCFVKDTLVFTDKGFKPIQDIVVGDYVLTHKSRFRRVLNTGYTRANTVFKMKAQGIIELIGTGNHPIFTYKKYKKWHPELKYSTIDLKDLQWTQLQEVSSSNMIALTFNLVNNSSSTIYSKWFIGCLTAYIRDKEISLMTFLASFVCGWIMPALFVMEKVSQVFDKLDEIKIIKRK